MGFWTRRGSGWLAALKSRAHLLKAEVLGLYIAARDPRTPWLARLVILLVVAYALSPIDLIPDFIPVLGLLDDLLLVPIGIALALRLIPPHVMTDARAATPALTARIKRLGWVGLAVIMSIWIAVVILVYLVTSALA